jgi:hypothetical protein
MAVFVMKMDFSYSQLRDTDHRTVFGWQKFERNLK